MRKGILVFLAGLMLFAAYSVKGQTFYSHQITNNTENDRNVDMAIDSRGLPHFVFERGNKIYYKYALGREELIADGNSPDLALDKNNVPHIVFTSNGNVNYLCKKDGVWQPNVIVSSGGGAFIDMDANGFAHIAYIDTYSSPYPLPETGIFYAHNKTGAFVRTKLANTSSASPRVTEYLSSAGIKIDNTGSIHVLYLRDISVMGYPDYSIGEITNANGTIVSTIKSLGVYGIAVSRNSIALDETGQAHIVYESAGIVYHARIDGGWQQTAIHEGSGASIAAKNNTIGIVYNDSSSINFILDSGSGFGSPVTIDNGEFAVLGLGSAFICYVKSDGQDDEIFLKTDEDLNSNLVGDWRFEIPSQLGFDSSSYGNHGLVTAGDVIDFPYGKVGRCAKFKEGKPGAAIEVPNSESLDISDRITIAAWIKRDGVDTDGGDAVVSRGNDGVGEQYGLYAHHPQGPNQMSAFFSGKYATSDTPIGVNLWSHVAMTYDGTTVNFYKNGKWIATKSCSGGLASKTSSLFIGASPLGGNEDYSGWIDELRIYKEVLSLSEIQKIYAENPTSIVLDKTKLYFGSVRGGTTTSNQSVVISNSGTGTLNWSSIADKSWIGVTPVSGTGSGVLQVSVNPAGLVAGSYSSTITISDPNASNSPQTINVGLNVITEGNDSPPFGNFATPTSGMMVASSVPVTGWVLDDIGMKSVKIYRGTNTTDRIYIGDAVFVEGARPDVKNAYPTYPQNGRAGWGYMLLTNFLPNRGNGIFTLLAYAKDTGDHEVLLGSKTITCDNAHAVKPFGAIDTPSQGGAASGTAYVNFGWALTPQPNSIPIDGSTLDVWVDGAALGHPVYNNYRKDIADFFPGYINSGGAVGYFRLKTTGFSNGVHTIAWSVTDTGGNGDGIGSRYFAIQNMAGGVGLEAGLAASALFSIARQKMGMRTSAEIAEIPEESRSPVYVRRGYGLDLPAETVFPETAGAIRITIPEVSRLAIYLNERESTESGLEMADRGRRILLDSTVESSSVSRYEAYELVSGEIHPLPIGASFDMREGVFYWQPGPGFLGEYTIVFVTKENDVGTTRRIVKIGILPKT